MTPQQKVFALIASAFLMILIIELVRRKKLAEEYSALWLLIGIVIFVLVLWYDLLLIITGIIGAGTPTTTLFLFGILCLVLINLHFSIKITALTNQVKHLAQRMATEEGEEK
jgi:hypothetical protein